MLSSSCKPDGNEEKDEEKDEEKGEKGDESEKSEENYEYDEYDEEADDQELEDMLEWELNRKRDFITLQDWTCMCKKIKF